MSADHEDRYWHEGEIYETPPAPDDPAPWGETRVVGTRRMRVDAYERVSGTAKYPSDIVLPGMLYGAVLGCAHPHARVRSVDTSAAEAMPGVRAVITGFEPLGTAMRPYARLIKEGRPGPGVLMVSALMAARGIGPTVGGVRRLQRELIAHLSRIVPWLTDHFYTVHCPALAFDPRTKQIQLDPQAMTPIYGRAQPQTLGLGVMGCETSYRNILIAGDTPFGSLGFEGAFLTALQALAITRRAHRLKKSFS